MSDEMDAESRERYRVLRNFVNDRCTDVVLRLCKEDQGLKDQAAQFCQDCLQKDGEPIEFSYILSRYKDCDNEAIPSVVKDLLDIAKEVIGYVRHLTYEEFESYTKRILDVVKALTERCFNVGKDLEKEAMRYLIYHRTAYHILKIPDGSYSIQIGDNNVMVIKVNLDHIPKKDETFEVKVSGNVASKSGEPSITFFEIEEKILSDASPENLEQVNAYLRSQGIHVEFQAVRRGSFILRLRCLKAISNEEENRLSIVQVIVQLLHSVVIAILENDQPLPLLDISATTQKIGGNACEDEIGKTRHSESAEGINLRLKITDDSVTQTQMAEAVKTLVVGVKEENLKGISNCGINVFTEWKPETKLSDLKHQIDTTDSELVSSAQSAITKGVTGGNNVVGRCTACNANWFCKTCNQNFCKNCQSMHEHFERFDEMSKDWEESTERHGPIKRQLSFHKVPLVKIEVSKYASALESKLQLYDKKELDLLKDAKNCETYHSKSKTLVHSEAEKRLTPIKHCRDHLLEKLNASEKTALHKIHVKQENLQEKKCTAKALLDRCNEEIRAEGEEVIHFYDELPNINTFDENEHKADAFSPFTQEVIRIYFDELTPKAFDTLDKTAKSENKQTSLEYSITDEFEINVPAGRILPISNTEAWISKAEGFEIFLITEKGLHQTPVRVDQDKHSIHSFTVTRTGIIFLTDHEHKQVLKHTGENSFDIIFDEQDFKPTGICTNSDDNVVVALVGHSRQSRLREFTQNGKMLNKRMGDYRTGLRLTTKSVLKYPERVMQSVNQDYIVTELLDQKVVALTAECKFKWEFPASEADKRSLWQRAEFNPVDICCSASGNVVVADSINKELVILSEEGTCLGTCKLDLQDVTILGLGMDTASRVWLGTSDSKIYIFNN